jgi:diguanylate cyclase (GGDEF)-like protein
VTNSQTATNGRTREKVGIDELTGVWNRPGFIAAALPLFDSCRRRETPVALAFFEFGTDSVFVADEPIVDQVLMGMADMMRRAFRGSDIIGRVGPVRFAVLLPDCTEEALAAIDGVRALTDATAPQRLTLTAGMVRSAPGGTLEDLLRAAEARAREIKNDG